MKLSALMNLVRCYFGQRKPAKPSLKPETYYIVDFHNRSGERYMLVWREGCRPQVQEVLERWAANPDLSLTIQEALRINHAILKGEREEGLEWIG